METGKKCCCFYAALTAFLVVLAVTYFNGYSLGNWTATTWLAVIIIVMTATFCRWCRQKEEDHGQD
ncbi:MAG: hypothetical protein H8E41_03165 [Desulfobulbaceae bacterium]|uniref:Uncharacterized protein n=1 Tax=Candidatus Desulfobia pelagia TaxID=2841692 RepID=A0A8J6NEB3_9BACT|nr:hypothetical protein [Candidatus Desulfobia pelagia]